MRIQDVFDILKNTELKQLIVGEDDARVMGFLNMALIEVFGKFNILQEEQTITVEEGRTRYRLMDSTQRVLQVFMRNLKNSPMIGNDGFKEVPINDINDDESVYTPQPYILHVPNPEEGRMYSLMVSVVPPYITKENIDTVDVLIPPQFLEPLVNYAAYRAYKAMNGDEQSEIGSHYRAYKASCDEIYKKGLYNYSILTNLKAVNSGFPTASGSTYTGGN